MYTIEVRYETGNSFGRHEETDTIGLQWEDKALEGYAERAKQLENKIEAMAKALKRIEKWYGEFPSTGKFWDEEKKQGQSHLLRSMVAMVSGITCEALPLLH